MKPNIPLVSSFTGNNNIDEIVNPDKVIKMWIVFRKSISTVQKEKVKKK